MNRDLRYPIKYAVLELKKEGGWPDNYEEVTIGYIASKCYLVESSTIYRDDGESNIRHFVVFPYSDFTSFYLPYETNGLRLPKEDEPKYNACNNPYPVRIVEKLFDSYEDAKRQAEIQNCELKHERVSRLCVEKNQTWKDVIFKFDKKFNEDMIRCNLFESMISEATKDDVITESSKIKTLKQLK